MRCPIGTLLAEELEDSPIDAQGHPKGYGQREQELFPPKSFNPLHCRPILPCYGDIIDRSSRASAAINADTTPMTMGCCIRHNSSLRPGALHYAQGEG
jgi:hypothetical protein